MEFEAITTQEAFDTACQSRIEENTKSVTKEVESRYKGWISPDDFKKNTDSLNQQISELTAKNKAYEISSTKRKVAVELGLPEELAERLNGETEEDIRADAETLSKFSKKKATPPFHSEKPSSDNKSIAYMTMLSELNK